MAKTTKAKPTKLKAPKLKAPKLKAQPRGTAATAARLKPLKAKPLKAKPAKAKPLKAKLIQRVVAALPPDGHTALVLDRLYQVVLSRRTADPALSHSARLLSRGRAKVAQKFGEEAVEALIEGAGGTKAGLVAESADVLYHLLLMWVACDIAPTEIWAELTRREGVSGIIEKASRPLPRDVVTRKIP
jgi:phosphoribosyl-ATP pyrophosphohydrolase